MTMNRRDLLGAVGLGLTGALIEVRGEASPVAEKQLAPHRPLDLEEDLRLLYEDDCLNSVDLTRHVRQLWLREQLPTLDDREFRRLLADGRLTRRDVARLVTPKYMMDLYQPPPGGEAPGPLVSPFAVPFATLPVSLFVKDHTPPARLAACVRAIVDGLAGEVRGLTEQAQRLAREHGNPVRQVAFTAPEVVAKHDGFLFEMFAYIHAVHTDA